MSTGHFRYEPRSSADLYRMLGEGDTPELYARATKLDTAHTVPYGGGTSVDGKTVYIDRTLYGEIQDGKAKVEGLTPDQIVQAIIEHEHTEWAIDAGDNPVDSYAPAHEFATAKEEKFVRDTGADPERYEAALKPFLERCQRREPTDPPADLWCGPYLDEPTARDKEIIRALRAHGVVDAHKRSKLDMRYRIGDEECRECRHFMAGKGPMRTCELTSGTVRANRYCDAWHR